MFLAGILLCCCLSLLVVQKYLPLVVSSAIHQEQRVAMLQQAMKQQLVHHVEHNGDGRHRQKQLSHHQSLKSILGHCEQSLLASTFAKADRQACNKLALCFVHFPMPRSKDLHRVSLTAANNLPGLLWADKLWV